MFCLLKYNFYWHSSEHESFIKLNCFVNEILQGKQFFDFLRLRIWCFLSNFENFFQVFFFLILRNFLACNFVNSKALAQIFPCEFCNILKNTCCAEHLRRTASNDVIIARFFCKIYCSLKSKIKKCER